MFNPSDPHPATASIDNVFGIISLIFKVVLAALGVFGASLFFGDSMITPAISVLSAVEGLKVAAPSLEHLIVPITVAIITVLFLVQRLGTAAVGRLFGLSWPSGSSRSAPAGSGGSRSTRRF